jgi:hypothetical protein
MGQLEKAKPRDVVIDAVVLAFANSGLRKVVGTDAFRSVLHLQYPQMVREGVFDLNQVWELIADQPGFSADAAKPPFCRVKAWERELGLRMELPRALTDLKLEDQMALARDCDVGSAELDRVLKREERRAGRLQEPDKGKASPSLEELRAELGRKPGVLAAALTVTVLTIGFVVYFGYGEWVGGASFEAVPVRFGDIPTGPARRRGNELGATLTDKAWMELPETERKAQMEGVLRSVEATGVRAIFLQDERGTLRATAIWEERPGARHIAVSLY